MTICQGCAFAVFEEKQTRRARLGQKPTEESRGRRSVLCFHSTMSGLCENFTRTDFIGKYSNFSKNRLIPMRVQSLSSCVSCISLSKHRQRRQPKENNRITIKSKKRLSLQPKTKKYKCSQNASGERRTCVSTECISWSLNTSCDVYDDLCCRCDH